MVSYFPEITKTRTDTHTRDDTSPAGTLTTARRLHVLANQLHSFIMNLQLLSKRQHYSHILAAQRSFSGRFCHLSAELCGCQSVTALYLDGSSGTSYQVKPGERCRLMLHGSRWQLNCGLEQVLENFPYCRWAPRFFPGRTLTSVPRLGALPGLFIVESSSFERNMWRFYRDVPTQKDWR